MIIITINNSKICNNNIIINIVINIVIITIMNTIVVLIVSSIFCMFVCWGMYLDDSHQNYRFYFIFLVLFCLFWMVWFVVEEEKIYENKYIKKKTKEKKQNFDGITKFYNQKISLNDLKCYDDDIHMWLTDLAQYPKVVKIFCCFFFVFDGTQMQDVFTLWEKNIAEYVEL